MQFPNEVDRQLCAKLCALWGSPQLLTSLIRSIALLLLQAPQNTLNVSHLTILLRWSCNSCLEDTNVLNLLEHENYRKFFNVVTKQNTAPTPEHQCSNEYLIELNTYNILSAEYIPMSDYSFIAASVYFTWPKYVVDSNDYLAVQTALILLTKTDPKFQMNDYTLHLADVGGFLRQQTMNDRRLECIYPRVDPSRNSRPTLSRLLARPQLKRYFVIRQSTYRPSEKVIELQLQLLCDNLLQYTQLSPGLITKVGQYTQPSQTVQGQANVGDSLCQNYQVYRDIYSQYGDQFSQISQINSGGMQYPSNFNAGSAPAWFDASHQSSWQETSNVNKVNSSEGQKNQQNINPGGFHQKKDKSLSEYAFPGCGPQYQNIPAQSDSRIWMPPCQDHSEQQSKLSNDYQNNAPSNCDLYLDDANNKQNVEHLLGGPMQANQAKVSEFFNDIRSQKQKLLPVQTQASITNNSVQSCIYQQLDPQERNHSEPLISMFLQSNTSQQLIQQDKDQQNIDDNDSINKTSTLGLEDTQPSGVAKNLCYANNQQPNQDGHPTDQNIKFDQNLQSTICLNQGDIGSTLLTDPSPNYSYPKVGLEVVDLSCKSLSREQSKGNEKEQQDPDESALDPKRSYLSAVLLGNDRFSDKKEQDQQKLFQEENNANGEPNGKRLFPEESAESLGQLSINITIEGTSENCSLHSNVAALSMHQSPLISKPNYIDDKLDRKKQFESLRNSYYDQLSEISSPRVRLAAATMIANFPETVRLEHFDKGVIHQINTRISSKEVTECLEWIQKRSDFQSAQNVSAYLTSWIRRFKAEKEGNSGSVQSSQAQLNQLPKEVQDWISEKINTCPWLCWEDFDTQTVRSLSMCCRFSKHATIAELDRLVGTQPGNIRSMAAFITRNMNNLYWTIAKQKQ